MIVFSHATRAVTASIRVEAHNAQYLFLRTAQCHVTKGYIQQPKLAKPMC